MSFTNKKTILKKTLLSLNVRFKLEYYKKFIFQSAVVDFDVAYLHCRPNSRALDTFLHDEIHPTSVVHVMHKSSHPLHEVQKYEQLVA